MAFAETRQERTVLEGVCPVKILLAGDVKAGDCLGYDSGWKLSASATAIQPRLVAGENGASGETITAYVIAVVKAVTTVADKATEGEIVALSDAGAYVAAGSGLPDVGRCVSVASDEKSAILLIGPVNLDIDTPRS